MVLKHVCVSVCVFLLTAHPTNLLSLLVHHGCPSDFGAVYDGGEGRQR